MFPLQVGSWTIKLEQLSVEKVNQSSCLLLMFPSPKWNRCFLGIDAFSDEDVLPPNNSQHCLPATVPHSFNFLGCAPRVLSGSGLLPAEVAVLHHPWCVGLRVPGRLRENETLLCTFLWKIILASAALAGFSCVVGLWLDLTVAVYKRFWYSVKYHVEFKFDTIIIESLWHWFLF